MIAFRAAAARIAVGAAVLAGGTGLLSRQVALAAKAQAARVLLERALAAHLDDGGEHRPWPWADMAPIAALTAPRLGVRRVIVAGATGRSLTFAAGHVDGTAAPNAQGNCVVAGHRDGAFRFLARVKPGETLTLRSAAGPARRYAVTEARVVHERDLSVLEAAGGRTLTLVTCWPFGALTGGPWRFVVVAREAPAAL